MGAERSASVGDDGEDCASQVCRNLLPIFAERISSGAPPNLRRVEWAQAWAVSVMMVTEELPNSGLGNLVRATRLVEQPGCQPVSESDHGPLRSVRDAQSC